MNTKAIVGIFALVLAASGSALLGCSDDSGSTPNNNNPFDPSTSTSSSGTSGTSGAGTSGTSGTSGDATSGNPACGKPAGCYCGEPASQANFLNRCTSAAALPVDLTVKAATIANVP